MDNVVRAWKDAIYRQSLSVEEQTVLPANPAGEIELADDALEAIFGAQDSDKEQDNSKITTVVSSSATLSQSGSNVNVSKDPKMIITIFGIPVPVETDKSHPQCIASADASPHK